MSKLVLHLSALLRMLEENPGQGLAGHELIAPGSARSAFLNLLYQDYTKGRRSEKEVKLLLKHLAELKIRWYNDRVLRSKAFDVACELGLPDTYLAEYIALTQLQAEALIVQDKGILELCGSLVKTYTLAEAEKPV